MSAPDVLDRIATANPVPEHSGPPASAWAASVLLDEIDARRGQMTKVDDRMTTRLEPPKSGRGLRIAVAAGAFAVVLVVIGIVALVAGGGDPDGDVVEQPTTTVAQTTAAPPVAPDPIEDLYGVWLTPDNSNLLSFNEDDTWSFSHAEDPVDSFRNRAFGPFTFDGELLTFFTDPASRNCSRNSGAFTEEVAGTYQAAITPEGNLELTDVDDLCVNRKIEFRGKLSDADALHQTGILVPYSP